MLSILAMVFVIVSVRLFVFVLVVLPVLLVVVFSRAFSVFAVRLVFVSFRPRSRSPLNINHGVLMIIVRRTVGIVVIIVIDISFHDRCPFYYDHASCSCSSYFVVSPYL